MIRISRHMQLYKWHFSQVQYIYLFLELEETRIQSHTFLLLFHALHFVNIFLLYREELHIHNPISSKNAKLYDLLKIQ